MGTLIKEMLFYQRQFIVEKVKKPLLKAIVTLALRYPEPTKENTVFKNTHIRLEIRDEFLKYFSNEGRKPLLEAAFRILIDECEHDGFYEFIHDEYITELLKRGWTPTRRGFPMYRYWSGKLHPDYCTESDPAWIDYWLQRRNEGTLIADEFNKDKAYEFEEFIAKGSYANA